MDDGRTHNCKISVSEEHGMIYAKRDLDNKRFIEQFIFIPHRATLEEIDFLKMALGCHLEQRALLTIEKEKNETEESEG